MTSPDALPTAYDLIEQGLTTSTDPRVIAQRLRLYPLDTHDRTAIDLTPDIDRNTSLAWIALCRKNDEAPTIFRYGGIPVRLEADDEGRAIFRELTTARMRHEIARAATFAQWSKKEKAYVACPPPKDLCENILATRNPPLDVVLGISPCPVVGPEGTFLTQTGYHAPTKTYIALTGSIPSVSAEPTDREVQDAILLLLGDFLGDFPFVGDADRCHALCLMLLPYLRPAILGPTPLHIVEAPQVSTGKSLLADMCLYPALGDGRALVSPVDDEEEARKRYATVLRDGRPALVIDNMSQITSPTLAAMLTCTDWYDRLLGRTESLSLPVRLVWVATGNNPTFSTEIARRCLRIRLDCGQEEPWTRTGFRHASLRQWASEHRAALTHACMTLIAHWIAQGRPTASTPTLGSFESYASILGGLMASCEIPGFLTNCADVFLDSDTEGGMMRTFIDSWWDEHATAPVSARELLVLARSVDGMDLGRKPEESSQAMVLGRMLSKWRDRVVSGHKMTKIGGRTARFRLAARTEST